MIDVREIFTSGMRELGLIASGEQWNQFEQLTSLMLEWNEKINLTAITEPDEIVIKHYLDSLVPLIFREKYPLDWSNVLDLGTGAGFPGIPLKIMLPKQQFTLADSLNKRITYLQTVVQELDLKNVEAVHGRAEEMGQDRRFRERYSIVFSRAVAATNVLAEYCLPFVKVGGHFIALKGPEMEEELNAGKKAIKELGGKTVGVEVLELPLIHDPRTVVIIEKIAPTPAKYPRKAGLPAKKPIE